jgi:hypothetical protein
MDCNFITRVGVLPADTEHGQNIELSLRDEVENRSDPSESARSLDQARARSARLDLHPVKAALNERPFFTCPGSDEMAGRARERNNRGHLKPQSGVFGISLIKVYC